MQTEEIMFINDVIQDNRADSRIQQAYEYIIEAIFNNSKLNWNKDGLILKSDEKFFNIIEILEPEMYKKTLRKLQDEENESKTE